MTPRQPTPESMERARRFAFDQGLTGEDVCVIIHHLALLLDDAVAAASGQHAATLKAVADEVFERWDKDMRSGKLLTALSGRLPGYRKDIDDLLAFLSAARDGWRDDVAAAPKGVYVWVAYPGHDPGNDTMRVDSYSVFAARLDDRGWDSEHFWRLHEEPHFWCPRPVPAPPIPKEAASDVS